MPNSTAPMSTPGTDQAALTELMNAAATYDHFRKKGEPVEFWEMLRLARDRRAISAPREGSASAPGPEVEAAIVHELQSIRRRLAPMVGNLRRYLRSLPGLPEPFDRFEMALAFLLASTREHQAIARWLAEPGRHEGRAAEKIRSLADITDPYRQALKPWVLEGAAIDAVAGQVDARQLESVRSAVRCREVLAGYRLDAELWETMLLMTVDSSAAEAALKMVARGRADAPETRKAVERLYEGVSDFRQMYAEWVQSVRTHQAKRGAAPANPLAFEVGLAFLLATSEAQDRLASWLEDPPAAQEEVVSLLGPFMTCAQGCLGALKSARA